MIKKSLHILILMSAIFLCATNISAQTPAPNLTPHLLIQYENGKILTFPIEDNLEFDVTANEIRLTDSSEKILNANDIQSLGIIYLTTVNDITFKPDEVWSIYRLDGTPVDKGYNGVPDTGKLEPNTVYIIKIGNKAFKYVSLK